MKIEKITSEVFNEYIEKFNSVSFLQTSCMGDVLKDSGLVTEFLALKDDETILAAGLAFYRKVFGGLRMDFMAGVKADSLESEFKFYDLLREYAKSKGVIYIFVKADHDMQYFDLDGNPTSEKKEKYGKLFSQIGYRKENSLVSSLEGMPDWQYLKYLSEFTLEDEDMILKSFNKNCQRKIKKAIELGINIREINIDEIDDFAKSIENIRDLVNELDPDKKKDKQRISSLQGDLEYLEEARKLAGKDKMMLSNMLMVYIKDEATYFLGGSLTDYQKLASSFLLQFEAMKRSMRRNIFKYNFYGIEGKFDGSDGVLKFKQNFNGYIVEKTGWYSYFPYPIKSGIISIVKKILGKQ